VKHWGWFIFGLLSGSAVIGISVQSILSAPVPQSPSDGLQAVPLL